MSKVPPLRVVSTNPAPGAGQMSRLSGFGRVAADQGRFGRSALRGGRMRGRIVLPQAPDRAAVMAGWSALMIRQGLGAHDISRLFDVTEQTGRNWIDGVACPTGDKVLLAYLMWPAAFADFAGAL